MLSSIQAVLLGIAAVALLFFSILESAYAHLSDVSLRVLRGEARSDPRQAFFDELMENSERFRMTLLLGIQISGIAIAILLDRMVLRLQVPHSLLVALAATLGCLILLRQLLPLLIAQNRPERILIRLTPLFKPYYRIMSVPVAPIATIANSLKRHEESTTPEDEYAETETTISDIQAFIDIGAEEGIIEEAEGALIQSIVEFGDRVVGEVMTPRPQIVALRATATLLEARDVMVSSKHSRLPVFAADMDDIEGVLYVRDLIAAWQEGRETDCATSVMRPAYFVPEVKPIADLLEEMRKSQVQIALVVDEYGSVSGVVTIEDLLEEIVGEIEDEDVEAERDADLVEAADGWVIVKGPTEIRKVEIHFEAELHADDFTTVAGLVISELGHLPAPGERLTFGKFEFEVVEADTHRVNLVKIRRVQQPSSDSAREAMHQV